MMPAKRKTTSKRKPAEQIHRVTGNLNVVEFSKAGSALTLEVFETNRKLGTIVIGRGSIAWSGASRRSPHRISWTRFAALMNYEAYGE
jgi:hypothetical protein